MFIKAHVKTKPGWLPKERDFTARVVVVTGANQGLGLEASDQLLPFKLSRLIIAARSMAKNEAAVKIVRDRYRKATINVMQLDMSSSGSNRAFSAQLE